ncbi:heterokaryon incompatibility protein-domain-containing protein [Suillus spraguei]|nr:heterokaryon incompatibility protein-domain-containing protein [Suillus spraguei]
MLWDDALLDAEKVIELNPSSYIGYQLKHAVLHGAHRYDEAIEAFKSMLVKLENASHMQTQKLRQQYINPSEAAVAIQETIKAQLNDAPHRVLNTFTGRLCNRELQISAFRRSTEYKELLSSSLLMHIDLRKEHIKDVVATYFRCVTLSHRWEGKEPLLQDVKDKDIYELKAVGGITKLQSFCKTARAAGYRWGWIDSCCIDQANNVELQKSLNSMFAWYRTSALTMVYLSDVPPSSKPGALARSAWNTRGWTVPEFLAPNVIRFYQSDWTPYLDDHSPNHKQSVAIMRELEDATGIDAKTLVAFCPGMINAREKLQWASTRFTTVEEDIAYSLFGIFGVQLPILYGEKRRNALGRLLQEIVAVSGDITPLDWVGTSSEFNSCLPADITSYEASPYMLPFISEAEMQRSSLSLQDTAIVELALTLYSSLDRLRAARFDHRRLHLPCIVFPVTEIRRRPMEQETYFTYEVKADGLHDLRITTEERLLQFSQGRPTRQSFLLVRPWDRRLLELPSHADDAVSVHYFTLPGSPKEQGPLDSELSERAMRLIVRLGQPFNAFLLGQQRSGEYKRIACDRDIITQVKEVDSVHGMMDVRTLEIL